LLMVLADCNQIATSSDRPMAWSFASRLVALYSYDLRLARNAGRFGAIARPLLREKQAGLNLGIKTAVPLFPNAFLASGISIYKQKLDMPFALHLEKRLDPSFTYYR
jgi:hypothetical protein